MTVIKYLIMLQLVLSAGASVAHSEPPTSAAHHACTDHESWTWGDAILPEWRSEMNLFLNGKSSPVRALSEALALRRQANEAESKLLAEYWISRSLLQAKLHHIAWAGFSRIAAYAPNAPTASIQAAALECLNRIHAEFPSMPLPKGVWPNLQAFLKTSSPETVWEFSLNGLMNQARPADELLRNFAGAVGGFNAWGSLARGLAASRTNDHSKAVQELDAFLSDTKRPPALSWMEDHAHLLFARSLYTLGNHERAANELRKIKKSSNELAATLTEMSWSWLMAEKYSEAIGTAMNLQAGGLRHTFTPEAPMVMAMALNELCQFPESVGAINQFKRNYEKSWRWLSHWNKEEKEKPLYAEAVRFLRKQGDVPARIGTEWVRSPVFISHQDEINLLFREKQASAGVGKSGSSEQKKLGAAVLKLAGELIPKIRNERARLQPGEPLSPRLMAELAVLKADMTHFKRMRNAAGTWHAILRNHSQGLPALEKNLVAGINRHLKESSGRMLNQLEEIAENNLLIEVEIYNGASQDIIWQNAHPGYLEIAKKLTQEQSGASAGKVWDWGRAPAGEIGDSEKVEIWEDELGSFKADLYDNCSSKERYLALNQLNARRSN